ncbi:MULTISPECIES: dienelactone hydrolase family protein [Micrococcus]|uniref:dienelactone hydrolase family protein n=1 Tax=Micrococcus TaxID=1269 RepID=UPI000DEB065F|nr:MULTISPECIES: dienelactone hydrolase family protein [Micrococcus]MBU8793265.1 dienelactone hydrolase family protein [Micrococcus luteus]MCD0179027.1 dienelactone hydrolase family protein [Micrococcus luteus]RBO88015.1 carboxymethylenebutenolidase [Micrococcus sp. KT16]
MMASKTPHQNVMFDLPTKDAGQDGDRTGHGYLALPASGKGPGVIVIQEWWGLVDHIKDVCDRLADLGFVALAPDLYGGWIAHDGDEAGEMMQNLPAEEGARQLAGAVDWLLARDEVTSQTVGAIGFCMGGGFVLALAAQQGDKVSAAVPFYGVGQGVPGDFSGVTAAIQGHYAEQDDSFPVEDARQQEQQIREESGADVEYFYYDAPHAFHNDENPQGNYRPEAAALAWDRAVSFLKEKVR